MECAIKFYQIYFSNTETKKEGEANEIRLCKDYVMWGAMINKEYWSSTVPADWDPPCKEDTMVIKKIVSPPIY